MLVWNYGFRFAKLFIHVDSTSGHDDISFRVYIPNFIINAFKSCRIYTHPQTEFLAMPMQPRKIYLDGTTPMGIGKELREQAAAQKVREAQSTYDFKANFAGNRRRGGGVERKRMSREAKKEEESRCIIL
jgi:hypothetical protein